MHQWSFTTKYKYAELFDKSFTISSSKYFVRLWNGYETILHRKTSHHKLSDKTSHHNFNKLSDRYFIKLFTKLFITFFITFFIRPSFTTILSQQLYSNIFITNFNELFLRNIYVIISSTHLQHNFIHKLFITKFKW